MPGKLASEGGAAEIKFLVDSGRLKVIEVTDVNNFFEIANRGSDGLSVRTIAGLTPAADGRFLSPGPPI
jgi:hypothetical protein